MSINIEMYVAVDCECDAFGCSALVLDTQSKERNNSTYIRMANRLDLLGIGVTHGNFFSIQLSFYR